MGSMSDVDDDDDDFNELYKAYTGPIASKPSKSQEIITSVNKRSLAGSDDEEVAKDPNAVPTDFTSREAKVWEAKSKATERNWKKRKEEEMICKLCGESGHFTQGCPTTLGANRKSQDFFERVPAREPHVKALFTEQVVNQLEKDIGCKIKIEEKFIIVSGKDRLILKRGVDSVHKIKEDGEVKGALSSQPPHSRSPARRSHVSSQLGRSVSLRSDPDPHTSSHSHSRSSRHEKDGKVKGASSSQPPRSRSPAQRSPVRSRLGRSVSLRSDPDLHTSSHFQSRSRRHEKDVEDHVREDLQKLTRGSPQARGKFLSSRILLGVLTFVVILNLKGCLANKFLVKGLSRLFLLPTGEIEIVSVVKAAIIVENILNITRLTHSSFGEAYDGARSHSGCVRSPVQIPNMHNLYDRNSQGMGGYSMDGWDADIHGANVQYGHKSDHAFFPNALEESALEYQREATELCRVRDKGVEEENHKHHEAVRETRENHVKNMNTLRGNHAKQWGEFLQLDAQKRQQQAHHDTSTSGFGGYRRANYHPEYESSSPIPPYPITDLPMDSRGGYHNPRESYPSSGPRDNYGDFEHQRRGDYRNAYNRF